MMSLGLVTISIIMLVHLMIFMVSSVIQDQTSDGNEDGVSSVDDDDDNVVSDGEQW